VTPVAAAVASAETTQLQAPADLVDKVVHGKQVVTAETGACALIAAPIHGGSDDVIGILWIDHKGPPWDQIHPSSSTSRDGFALTLPGPLLVEGLSPDVVGAFARRGPR
jgi:hypothetical protein